MSAKAPSRFPRDLATRVLARVLSDQEALDRVLDSLGAEAAENRAWLQEVCSGTLRWKGRLELAIDSAALKKKPSGALRRALLLGAYQLIVQEQTARAAIVSEVVEQVKRREGEAPARFANALLRKVADHAAEWRDLPFPAGAPSAQAARWASLPVWMWERLVRDHGLEWAKQYAQASLARPQLWVKSREPGWSLPGLVAGPIPGSHGLATESSLPSRITEWPGFASGEFLVQDVSSQLLVHEVTSRVKGALGTASPSAIDWCAAPGGKAVGMAWAGFQVVAADLDEARLALLRQTVTRTASRIRVLSGAELASVPPASLVWVDAPCTGSGILRRHPDARWLKRESDLAELSRTQSAILEAAWKQTQAGGCLAYSVCSVFHAEGQDRIQAFLTHAKDASLEKEWMLSPQEAPFGDGFYGALIRKRS